MTVELGLEVFERTHVGTDVLSNGGVRATARFDGEDAGCGKGAVFDQKLLVFAGEYVVRDCG